LKLVNKKILLISPEPWDHIFVSKHHYAIYLGESNEVYFLNPPNHKFKESVTHFTNVKSVNYWGFPKGLRFYPAFAQLYFIKKTYKKLQKKLGVEFDIVWSFDNSVFYDFRALPKSTLKISHIVDLNQNFQTGKAAMTADICFGVTNSIVDRLKKFQKHSYFINHGYNHNAKDKLHKISLPGKNSIKVVYAGNLSMNYLDWDLIFDITKNNFNVDFIFIGPNGKDYELNYNKTHGSKYNCAKLVNTYFVGRIGSNDLQSWYKAANILLISYQEKHHLDQANPHKMMEYLGSGNVVVATKTIEFVNSAKKGLIAMSEKNEDLPGIFKSVVANLIVWNSENNRVQRIEIALKNSYTHQIERIKKYIK
jgi:hypothetical protein